MDLIERDLKIDERIYSVRGRQVMIDRDLALLYGVETKQLNRAVKRNIERFPDDFMFQLTAIECSRCQIGTLNITQGQNLKYMPYAFTEYGIAMLSGILRSETAIKANIRIMRAFANMRKIIADKNIFKRIENLEYHQLEMSQRIDNTNDKIEQILQKLENETPTQGIFFDGQIYDAYSFVAELVRNATKRIVLIDNYIDDTVLTLLSKRAAGVETTIYTGKISKQLQLDIDRHNAQYPPIEVKTFQKAHDRFLIIDNEVYLIGASIKDLGKKWFGFTLMENTDAQELIGRI
ncbi:MAG: ORF6N domain-containing protein [Bacteroidales bacterium]|nr:ORF6N domain-containing protein [Bacteroidales bacterium]